MADIARVGARLSDKTRWQSLTGIYHAVTVREPFSDPGTQTKYKSAVISKVYCTADRSPCTISETVLLIVSVALL